jgi:hypothetical protein
MIVRRVRERLANALDRRFSQLESRIDALQVSLNEQHEQRAEAERVLQTSIDALEDSVNGELRGMIRAIATEESRNRRALYALRERPDYRLAFTESRPLVSICIPTATGRTELLIQRALPSALAQTYENIEVVVVGDAVPAETASAIEGLQDDRLRFVNLTNRVAHPDPHRQWLTAAVMPRNEAHRQARGLWIADLDDDDALTPDAVEALLDSARSRDLEVTYGMARRHDPHGESTIIGAFPPKPLEPDWREKGMLWQPWQGAASVGSIFHGGLRFFAREHIAAVLGIPGDFYRLERMVRAGVRFGMLEQVIYDYYPSKLWDESSRDS